jgi:hypothetical protein
MAVKCNKCGEDKETAGQVRICGFCRNDGTGNEIPKDLGDDATMEAALDRKPGLSARFTPIIHYGGAPGGGKTAKATRMATVKDGLKKVAAGLRKAVKPK